MMRAVRSVLLAGLVLAIAGVAYAQEKPAEKPTRPRGPGAFGGFGGGMMMSDRALEQLNLTDQQKEKIKSIREKHQAKIEELRKQLNDEMKAMTDAITATFTDEQKAKVKEMQDRFSRPGGREGGREGGRRPGGNRPGGNN